MVNKYVCLINQNFVFCLMAGVLKVLIVNKYKTFVSISIKKKKLKSAQVNRLQHSAQEDETSHRKNS